VRRVVLIGLVVALLAAPVGRAVAAETVPAAGDVAVYVGGPDSRHTLILHLYPQRGIATVATMQGIALVQGTFLENSYGIVVPKGRFEGSIDLKIPGVGEAVGTVSTEEPLPPELPAADCARSRRFGIGATFNGTIRFRGLGGYGPWRAHRAQATVAPECERPRAPKEEADALFAALAEHRPPLPGPAGFGLVGRARSPHRFIEFIAFGDVRSDREAGTFVAVDQEWLPHEVAVERLVSLATKQFSASLAIGPGGAHPTHVTVTPPTRSSAAPTTRGGPASCAAPSARPSSA
jgi:hypothetical protein